MPPPYSKLLLIKALAGSEHNTTISGLGKGKEDAPGSPTVRFASVNEEIEPEKSLESVSNNISGGDEATLKELSKSLQGTQLQGRRMSRFAFEPVSLPASRVGLQLSSVKTWRPDIQISRDAEGRSEQVFMRHPQAEQHVSIPSGIILDCP
jgi:hypothetical protein